MGGLLFPEPPLQLVDLYCYRPPEELRVDVKDVEASWTSNIQENVFKLEGDQSENESADVMRFQEKVFKKAGLGENDTFLPKSIHPKYCGHQPKTDLDSALEECKMAVCGAVEGLLDKVGLAPKDIDILVSTCSIYCPTPSMASMITNHFKMRTDIQSYHLGGMGCSNGVVSISLIKDLLKAHPNSNAILVCNETTTPAFYKGRDKHRLVTNVLFRMGASAMLFSNKPQMVAKAKYRLHRHVRVHMGGRDAAYKCIWYGPDEKGLNGVYLGLDVVKEASRGLQQAISKVAPHILTWKQIGQFLMYQYKKLRAARGASLEPFAPSFAECIDHFLIHAGGAKVLDGIGTQMQLSEWHLGPSRAVLHDYGNISSSTTWYTLAEIESTRGVAAGERVLQIGVGSGIKCGVCVWEANKDILDVHDAWAHRPQEPEARNLSTRRKTARLLARAFITLLRLLISLAILALIVLAVYRGYQRFPVLQRAMPRIPFIGKQEL